MSGRIETISSRNRSDYKFSKNEIVGAHKAGVDIGEDLEAGGGGTKTAGKVTTITSKKVGAIGTSGLQENYEQEANSLLYSFQDDNDNDDQEENDNE